MKGICFTEEMFRAVTDGRKTQSRRIIPKPNNDELLIEKQAKDYVIDNHAPFKIGDIVYLKEPYYVSDHAPDGTKKQSVYYGYGGALSFKEYKNNFEWENKLFMPAKYARHFVQITSVRIERLQEITKSDICLEGISSREKFKEIWTGIHGKGSWHINPWVFVYDFKLRHDQRRNT